MKWISIISLALLVSCSKSTSCTSTIKGKLKNLTGLDGCGWVIEANGKTFEPVNLGEFDSSLLAENQKIYFSYSPFTVGSICMVGETIQLKCVEKR
jgi:hypothetical protein